MTIYKKTNHRQIYESHFGPIPKDSSGRSFEIHHIDGNPLNNNITNLIALSIKDHYDVHYKQGDWIACFRISKRMQVSPEVKSELARKSNLERVKNGTHNFQNKELASSRATKANTTRISNGTHNLLKANRTQNSFNPRKPNSTIYTFEHKVSKERVSMTQFQFVNTFSLNQGNVSSMIKNPSKSVKGWKLV
jgi:HNH endonuclease